MLRRDMADAGVGLRLATTPVGIAHADGVFRVATAAGALSEPSLVVDTRDLDAPTMMARCLAGLFVLGDVVDVTGWVGGCSFQWAWSSGWVAGQIC